MAASYCMGVFNDDYFQPAAPIPAETFEKIKELRHSITDCRFNISSGKVPGCHCRKVTAKQIIRHYKR
jgi:hypothetical protein